MPDRLDIYPQPNNRMIYKLLLNPLSLRLLEGEFKPGDNIYVTAKGDELKFEKGK